MTRSLAALIMVGAIGWGVACGAGVAAASGGFPQGQHGGQGPVGEAGPAGSAGSKGPTGLQGPKGLGGESGFWRDFASDPVVSGTAFASPELRSTAVEVGHAECEALQRGRTPDELIFDSIDMPRAIQKAMLDAAIDNLCPDYGTGT